MKTAFSVLLAGSAAVAFASECSTFCMNAMMTCPSQFGSRPVDWHMCKAMCNRWDMGTAGATSGNTLACREYHLGAAKNDKATHCPHASYGGGGICSASACDTFCTSAIAKCPSTYPSKDKCVDMCNAWATGTTGATGGDSLACRSYHLGVASGVNDAVHCPHASPSGGNVCVDKDVKIFLTKNMYQGNMDGNDACAMEAKMSSHIGWGKNVRALVLHPYRENTMYHLANHGDMMVDLNGTMLEVNFTSLLMNQGVGDFLNQPPAMAKMFTSDGTDVTTDFINGNHKFWTGSYWNDGGGLSLSAGNTYTCDGWQRNDTSAGVGDNRAYIGSATSFSSTWEYCDTMLQFMCISGSSAMPYMPKGENNTVTGKATVFLSPKVKSGKAQPTASDTCKTAGEASTHPFLGVGINYVGIRVSHTQEDVKMLFPKNIPITDLAGNFLHSPGAMSALDSTGNRNATFMSLISQMDDKMMLRLVDEEFWMGTTSNGTLEDNYACEASTTVNMETVKMGTWSDPLPAGEFTSASGGDYASLGDIWYDSYTSQCATAEYAILCLATDAQQSVPPTMAPAPAPTPLSGESQIVPAVSLLAVLGAMVAF